ncbi:hypothetical protein IAG44_09235 [Streptomyces roseirectus]|uniref:Uncharacterized protein n=1 Tax=Streptomyces roseirectus TaxID=2768066 RepID=A0A7H0I9Z2_9ACTN|nr:hypothetical protein [Streptomyces roseirectus]QNP69608.1 hypothetical protein IAG44_09235 [Streptomyces roseirectus]
MREMFGRGRKVYAVPVPREEDRVVLEKLGREVLGELGPEDVLRCERLLKEFRADPQAMAGSRRRPPVGMGTSVPDLAAYVFPAVAWVLGAVSQRVADSVMDVVGEVTRRKVARLLERRRGRDGADSRGAASGVGSAEGDDLPVSVAEKAALVTAFTNVFAVRLGLDGDYARELAEAIVEAMAGVRGPDAP